MGKIPTYIVLLLLWNKFRTSYSDYKLFIRFSVIIRTNKLSLFWIRNEREQRLELNFKLLKQVLNNREIANYLSLKNYKTFRSKKNYTSKFVWMSNYKYKKRLLRKSVDILQIKEGIYVIPLKNLNKNLFKKC